MGGIREIETSPLPLSRFAPLVGEERYSFLLEMAARARAQLAGSTVWNVNSTAAGGGVAEMLQVLVGYGRDGGIDVRWLVISSDAAFFQITKRLHNHLHGFEGAGEIGASEAEHYRVVTDALGAEMAEMVRPGDVVLLHDPQPAGMSARLSAAGAHVVWRCHIGSDSVNEWTDSGWALLRPHLEQCQAFVFSRESYVPEWLPPEAVVIIPPSIDPFSAKNEDLTAATSLAILHSAGIVANRNGASPSFTRRDGSQATVVRQAALISEHGPITASVPLVVQVSRWDKLKDMAGVMAGFVRQVVPHDGAHLALVGPAVDALSDDPEGARVLAECVEEWRALGSEARSRVTLVTLPMDDVDENAVMVNAIQRHATVVVQKSLAEGFGLTVAEAMWKARPVVASAVGGITDQIVPGTGVLLSDPSDRDAFGVALSRLLADPAAAARMGEAARARVLDSFVGDKHLVRYAELIGELHLRGAD